MRAGARALFDAADKETPVADLEYDSLIDSPDGVAMPTRTIRFGRWDGQVTVVAASGSATDVFDVEVQVVPAGSYTIRTQHVDGQSLSADTDPSGRVRLSGLQVGLVSFYVFPGPSRVGWRTAWVRY